MAQVKAVFFDVDGTLVSFRTHRLPKSTERALEELHDRGILTFLATGRPRCQLQDFLTDGFGTFPGFDGYVTMSGSACFDDDGIFFECPIERPDVDTIVGQIKDGLYEGLVMHADRCYATRLTENIEHIAEMAGLVYPLGDVDDALHESVYQFCAFVPPEEEHLVTDSTTSVMTTRWNPLFCDVIPKASSKPRGVEETCKRFGISPEEAMAFGDGGNDATMLARVGIGVALGNGTDEAKAAADYVTDDIDEDGLYNALRHFGVL